MTEFEELLDKYDLLMKKISLKLRYQDPRFYNVSDEDLKSITQYAAWEAYKVWIKDREKCKYPTLFTLQLKVVRNRIFTEFYSQKNQRSQESFKYIETKSKNELESIDNEDWAQKVMSKLNPMETEFIKMRLFEGKTLEECSKKFNCVISTMKNLESTSMAKIKAYGKKYA